MLFLLLLVQCYTALVLASSPCSTDWDCSLNGECQSGRCVCDPAWNDGANCSKLQFQDVGKPTTPQCNAPGCAFHGNSTVNTSTTWGGSVIKGHDGKFHMYAAEMVNNCGLGDWLSNSQVAHAVSDTPLGPFTRSDTAVHVWSHNPEVALTTTKENNEPLYLLFGMGDGNPVGNVSNCDSTITQKQHRHSSPPQMKDPIRGNQTAVVHTSSSPYGPWTPVEITLVDLPPLGNWAPSVVVLPNGTVRLMLLNGPENNIVQVMQADDWRGPYVLLSPQGKAATSCSVHRFKWCAEGEFLYQDARKNWHALFHLFDYPDAKTPMWCGGHSFSRDGIIWSNVSQAYNNNISISDQGNHSFLWAMRRERPKLLFDDNGVATHLYNGVDMPGYGTYTYVQQLAT
eukprot:m.261565 g.261565  ORF g.261565 m.261565 type:complete len:398 (+) comp16218_c0_seq1:46-1239(+)